jgi:PadR family transcriptional regulator PadR
MYVTAGPPVTVVLTFKPCYCAKQNSVDQAQLLKGVLELAVLAVIARGETYGYEILSTLESAGFDGVGDASVYGTLRRLEQAGHLESRLAASDSGPARKYYSVTESGAEQLQAGTDTWRGISDALERLVKQ